MAAHVVVVDASLKRVTVKTTPAKPLSDVLEEACTKLGVSAQNYTLKHGNKQVDLSRSVRLSGLSPGAKLALVQASRSPSVVSVALQLPTTGDASGSLARLTEKFPSNTSIWQILRRFEAGATGSTSSPNPTHNFTQRATPLVASGGSSGAGRLCYEMPVINLMGRELSTFVDLQKTLNQLGYNSGSCLLRLNFRNTQQPLEEAMAEISHYFNDAQESSTTSRPAATNADTPMSEPPSIESQPNGAVPGRADSASPSSPQPPTVDPESTLLPISTATEDTTSPPSAPLESTKSTSDIAIFAPPSSTAPAASQTSYNENDYVPSIEHAQLHQASLVAETRNKKLLSDEELAAQQRARTQALSSIREVVVRFRFPDQSQAQRGFDQTATTADLYNMCREIMDRPDNEEFHVRISRAKGSMEAVPEATTKLIQGLGWQGRVLLTVVWGDNVSADRRRKPCLKDQYRQQAEPMKVDLPDDSKDASEATAAKPSKQGKSQSSGSGSKQDVETKLRGFLKGLSKK